MAGAEIKLSRPVEDKNPVVIGRLGRNPDLPTVTFYGHYDVQPAMEREWATDPFEVAAIDGYFYGRGTSDNKACHILLSASFGTTTATISQSYYTCQTCMSYLRHLSSVNSPKVFVQ